MAVAFETEEPREGELEWVTGEHANGCHRLPPPPGCLRGQQFPIAVRPNISLAKGPTYAADVVPSKAPGGHVVLEPKPGLVPQPPARQHQAEGQFAVSSSEEAASRPVPHIEAKTPVL